MSRYKSSHQDSIFANNKNIGVRQAILMTFKVIFFPAGKFATAKWITSCLSRTDNPSNSGIFFVEKYILNLFSKNKACDKYNK